MRCHRALGSPYQRACGAKATWVCLSSQAPSSACRRRTRTGRWRRRRATTRARRVHGTTRTPRGASASSTAASRVRLCLPCSPAPVCGRVHGALVCVGARGNPEKCCGATGTGETPPECTPFIMQQVAQQHLASPAIFCILSLQVRPLLPVGGCAPACRSAPLHCASATAQGARCGSTCVWRAGLARAAATVLHAASGRGDHQRPHQPPPLLALAHAAARGGPARGPGAHCAHSEPESSGRACVTSSTTAALLIQEHGEPGGEYSHVRRPRFLIGRFCLAPAMSVAALAFQHVADAGGA